MKIKKKIKNRKKRNARSSTPKIVFLFLFTSILGKTILNSSFIYFSLFFSLSLFLYHFLMIEQRLYYTVNLDTAETVISLASKKQNAFKLMMAVLREVEEQIEIRRKTNMRFYQISSIVEGIYNKEIYSYRQLSSKTNGEIKFLENDIYQLNNQREMLKQEMNTHEQELNDIRQYAEQRRNKKAKREKQYHDFYHVPIVAAQYKKKYVRARDKNSDAEEQVSKIRCTVDACQKAISEITKLMMESQKKIESFMIQKQEVDDKSKQAEDMIAELQDGQKFWSSFDHNQLPIALKATQGFIEAIQRHTRKSGSHTLSQIVHYESEFVKLFRLALNEYGEAEAYAQSRWGSIQVAFNCAKCNICQVGWPNLDKVRTTDLLCDSCYKEARTSMILEKKINSVIGASRSHQLQTLPSGSSLSITSFATTASSSSASSNKSSKSGFKKMFQMIKNNKRSSTDTSQDFTSHSPDLYVS